MMRALKISGGGVTASIAPTSITFTDPQQPVSGTYDSIIATADFTLNPPSSPVDGMTYKARIKASGGDRTMTLHAAIKIPSDSTFTGTKVLTNTLTYIIKMEYIGSFWMLQVLEGGV